MQTIEQSREMAKLACEALADKKGEDIRVIDIAGISVLADYFIIANGTNESQVRALVDNVEEELAKAGYEFTSDEKTEFLIEVENNERLKEEFIENQNLLALVDWISPEYENNKEVVQHKLYEFMRRMEQHKDK